jgi:UDP-3-O-[3-hydroxymyristoyl] N-acetylglucosamine deacetylase
LGASLDNCLVFDDEKILNTNKQRCEYEPVKHKILDAIGDLYMFGFPIIGKYESKFGNHDLNYKLLLELKKNNAYKIVSL